MLRPPSVRLSTQFKPFPRLSSSLSSSGIFAAASPRTTHHITRHRRNSSSKPSSSAPPSGSDSSAVSTNPHASTTRKKGTFSKASSRIKAKETVPAASSTAVLPQIGGKEDTYAVPSVPSTQHLHLQDIHLASLFAFHRPISINHSLPQYVSNKKFGQIFTSKPPQFKAYGDVFSTIPSTVSNIIKDLEKNHENKSIARVVVSDSVANANIFDKNNKDPNYITQDGTPVYIDVEAMVRNLPPFQAPLPPKRGTGRKTRARTAKAVKMEEFFTPSLEMIESFETGEQLPVQRLPIQPFLARMHVRQQQYYASNPKIYHAISVRRQRKLKMKKHKFKKLMKRTRNLRRRQDKL